jgi:CheY-like chemotaxis protein
MEISERARALIPSSPILLVEDNEDEVFMMQRAFRKSQIHNPLHTVRDGEEAIAYLEGTGRFSDRDAFPVPIVIFLDLNMPKKGGLEVLQHIRSRPELQKLTVNVLSSSTRPADIDQSAQLGANAYLIKPTQITELEEMVRCWYGRCKFEAFAA